MCFGLSRNRSTKTVPLPKADFASDVARLKESSKLDCSLTTRIPRPPPPNAALMMIGNPNSSVNFLTSSNFSTGPSVPGTTGTLALIARVLAETLSPSESMTSGEGPTNYCKIQLVTEQKHIKVHIIYTYDETSLLNLLSKFGIFGEETISYNLY
jgi:hypothetical protein